MYEIHTPRILLPVRPGFIAFTLAAALVFDMLPWQDVTGLPDLLAVVITFWCIHQPRKVGIGIPFALGLLMDVANGALMGQHAFAYAVLAFTAMTLSRRILWFALWPQALHVLGMLLGTQLLIVAVRLFSGAPFPGFAYFIGSLISAALWPAVTLLLMAPQRAPESVDENRPI